MKKIYSLISLVLFFSCDNSKKNISGPVLTQFDFILMIGNLENSDIVSLDNENSYSYKEIMLFSDKELTNNVTYEWWGLSKQASGKSNKDYVKVDEHGEIKYDKFAGYINLFIEKESLIETGVEQEYQTLLYFKLREEVEVLKLNINYNENKKEKLTHVFYNKELVFDYKESFHVTMVK